MRQEIIKTEDGMVWMKFHLSLRERLGRFGRILPDLFLPRFWDGNKDTYGPLDEIWDTFISNLTEGILGYWVGCQPITTEERDTGAPSSEVGDKTVTPRSCDPHDTPHGLTSKAKNNE